ncbi:MAG: GNAT family N-acetyltransferase [Ignavibacteriaceae bacterium]|nr:GNAT family N-acetyltransferase [Ignavibacteriaceae bacterium]
MIHNLFVQQSDPLSPDAIELTQRLFFELEAVYGKGTIENFLDENGSFIYFLVIKSDNINIACGAVNHIDSTTAEIKRMYVREEYRGKGLSNLLMNALEEFINNKGYKKIILETGGKQPVALNLYKKYGYFKIPCYSRHAGDPESICFAKNLP